MDTAVRQLHTPQASDEERQVRTDLAALHRLYVKYGWTDLIYTHLTARSPDNPNHYLIKPDELLMDEVTASSLLKVDMEGNLISGDGPPNQAGHLIHTAVLGARPEINFSAHTHSRAGAAVSCMKRGLLPLSQHANMILPAVALHEYQDVTNAEDECAAIARDLGQKFALIMNNHGLLACGRSVAECFYYLYYLEMACKIQVDVLASGEEPLMVSQTIVDGLYADGGVPDVEPPGVRAWPPMLRMLDRIDESYRH
ncbi:MAG: class II aldolase [Alphaproteobacteria bacterium]|nr:class II aldolase [Alphaproteobacteria bacterium]